MILSKRILFGLWDFAYHAQPCLEIACCFQDCLAVERIFILCDQEPSLFIIACSKSISLEVFYLKNFLILFILRHFLIFYRY